MCVCLFECVCVCACVCVCVCMCVGGVGNNSDCYNVIESRLGTWHSNSVDISPGARDSGQCRMVRDKKDILTE